MFRRLTILKRMKTNGKTNKSECVNMAFVSHSFAIGFYSFFYLQDTTIQSPFPCLQAVRPPVTCHLAKLH